MLELLNIAPVAKKEKTLILLQAKRGKRELVSNEPITAGFGTTSVTINTGPFGTAEVFDIRNGSMLLNGAGMNKDLLSDTQEWTVEFFVSDLSTRKSFCSKGRSYFNRQPPWNLYDGNGAAVLSFAGYASTRWEHVAVTQDQTGVRVFSNGIMMMSRAQRMSWGAAGTPWNIGYTDAGYGNGYFDQFRVSNVNRYPGPGFSIPTAPFTLD